MTAALYPPLAPYREGALRVGALHTLHHEESGNPRGKPVVVLHGGPGAGSDPGDRRFFDPESYRIVQVDQRGCGRSTPHGALEENTTWELVADLEALREHLGIARWQLFGGSWGATLALAYAQSHPARVTELVLRGIFLVRRAELDWLYARGASLLFPDRWEELTTFLPEAERGDLVRAYHARVTSPDAALALAAARAWCRWEASTCTLLPDAAVVAMLAEEARSLALARIETHYFVHGAWLDDGDGGDGRKGNRALLAGVGRIRHLPCVIVQGRYDLVCPTRSAWDLHRAWPGSILQIVPDAGHSAHEPGIAAALVAATDTFRAVP